MRAHLARIYSATFLLMCALPLTLHAGNWHFGMPDPCDCDYDWQWFAPTHDFCCEPNPPAAEGYFFEADRSHWWLLRPDRSPIGNNVQEQVGVWLPNSVTLVYSTNPADATPWIVGTPQQGGESFIYPIVSGGSDGTQFNAIDDAISETSEGWGWRYTLGHICDDVGWMISVIPEVDITQVDEYGFDDKRLDQLGAAQGLDGIDGVLDPRTLDLGPNAGQSAILPVDGLLTVPVLFNDPFGLLTGFRDADGDGVPDAGTLPTRIAVVFDDLRSAHEARVTSVEVNLMQRKRRLVSGYDMEGFLGVRYFELDDLYSLHARGGVLADMEVYQNAENRIVGPQIGFRASRQNGRWSTTFQTRAMAGANFLSVRQDGVIGSHLPVGFAGVPVALGGNEFFHRVNDELFSPLGEFKFNLSCQVTRHVNLTAGWNGIVAGGITRAANTVRYDLPSLGIEQHEEEIWAHSVNLGVEINR